MEDWKTNISSYKLSTSYNVPDKKTELHEIIFKPGFFHRGPEKKHGMVHDLALDDGNKELEEGVVLLSLLFPKNVFSPKAIWMYETTRKNKWMVCRKKNGQCIRMPGNVKMETLPLLFSHSKWKDKPTNFIYAQIQN